MIDPRESFRAAIGAALGTAADNVTMFSRGRVALYAILRALDIGPGDEVIVPSFTCVAVPNAIIYTGARPVWVDIDPTDFTIDSSAVEAAVTPRTRVILAQNTFGLAADLQTLSAIAELHDIRLVDDSTHGLGGRYRGQPNGLAAPLSFLSTQWSKPISTGLGGFAVSRDAVIAGRLRAIEAMAPEQSAVLSLALRTLVAGRERAGGGFVFRTGRSIYRSLSRLGALPASSAQGELSGTAMPHGFLARLSQPQARLGVERISGLFAAVERRREIAHRYSEWLSAAGRTAAVEHKDVEHSFLRYPVRVVDRARFSAAARRAGIDLGDWFVSPVHPVRERLDRWGYQPGTAPVAEQVCREIVNLPTDPGLRESDVDHVLSFLRGTVDLIR